MLWLLSVVVSSALASSVDFVHLPSSVSLDPPSSATLSYSSFPQVSAHILGISAATPNNFPVRTNLFDRPNTFLVLQADGIPAVPGLSASYPLIGSPSSADWSAVSEELSEAFGQDGLSVSVGKNGVQGSSEAAVSAIKNEQVDVSSIKSKASASIVENVLRLAAYIKNNKESFDQRVGPSFFYVEVPNAEQLSDSDLQYLIDQLKTSLASSVGDKYVFAVLANDGTVTEEVVRRAKRAATPDDESIPFYAQQRINYNVSVFVSSDYAAMFAIIAGLSIVLALAVLYIAVGLWNMDPGKDSIIYRMTTTRMKRD